jgi:hypothetical protein
VYIQSPRSGRKTRSIVRKPTSIVLVLSSIVIAGVVAIRARDALEAMREAQEHATCQVTPIITRDGKTLYVGTGAFDALNGATQLFESLDGVKVFHQGIGYSTTRQAKGAVKQITQGATILESTPITDDGGRIVGERVLWVKDVPDSPAKQAGLCFRTGPGLNLFGGQSIEHVIAFRDWFNKAYLRRP